MTAKIRSFIFLFCSSLLFLAVLIPLLANALNPSILPEKMRVSNTLSYLEGRNHTPRPSPSPQGIIEGDFQKAFESFVADAFPLRDDALLANAAFQRKIINQAALPFGYSVQPTFFGSDYCFDQTSETFYEQVKSYPGELWSEKNEETQNASRIYASFASRHPEISCLIYSITSPTLSPLNATIPLVNNAWTADCQKRCFQTTKNPSVPYADNTALINSGNYYLKTDHHWTIEGAYLTYLEVVNLLGISQPLSFDSQNIVKYEIPFFGTLSRYALYTKTQPDFISDYTFDYPLYSITVNNEPNSLRGNKLAVKNGKADPEKYSDRHSEYFGSSETEVIYQNPNKHDGSSLLVVRDSYMSDIEPLLAFHYETTYFVDLRNSDAPALDEYLLTHPTDTILFMGSNMLTDKNVLKKIT